MSYRNFIKKCFIFKSNSYICIQKLNNKKMTTEQINAEFSKLLKEEAAKVTAKFQADVKVLVRLGDSTEVAIKTVLAEVKHNSTMYDYAYNS